MSRNIIFELMYHRHTLLDIIYVISTLCEPPGGSFCLLLKLTSKLNYCPSILIRNKLRHFLLLLCVFVVYGR
jgi:hypothetical protein